MDHSARIRVELKSNSTSAREDNNTRGDIVPIFQSKARQHIVGYTKYTREWMHAGVADHGL